VGGGNVARLDCKLGIAQNKGSLTLNDHLGKP